MITLIICLALVGFFILYSTSNRAELTLQYKLQTWVRAHNNLGTYFGVVLLVFSLILAIVYLGTGAGTFAFLIILMTTASLVVLIAPLRFIKLFTLIILILLSFGVEILLI